MSYLFSSGCQSIGASASVFPRNFKGWFPLGLTDLISLLSKGLSRIFSSTTVEKHQFFGTHPSLWSSSHICLWLLEKTIGLTIWTFVSKVMSLLFNTLSSLVLAFLPYINHFIPCIDHLGRLSYLSLLFFSGTQHSVRRIFAFHFSSFLGYL